MSIWLVFYFTLKEKFEKNTKNRKRKVQTSSNLELMKFKKEWLKLDQNLSQRKGKGLVLTCSKIEPAKKRRQL